MVDKTISLTHRAYHALKAVKFKDESFSDTVIRVTKIGAAAKFFGILKDKPELDSMRRRIKENRLEIEKEFKARQKKIRTRLG